VPAAAVIPAPIAYIKVAAVKKLVVGFLMRPAWPAVVTRVSAGCCPSVFLLLAALFTEWWHSSRIFYFEQIRVFQAGFCHEYISME
jgi:hypothetical protein